MVVKHILAQSPPIQANFTDSWIMLAEIVSSYPLLRLSMT